MSDVLNALNHAAPKPKEAGEGAAPKRPAISRKPTPSDEFLDQDYTLQERNIERVAQNVGAYSHRPREVAPKRAEVKRYPLSIPQYLYRELEVDAFNKGVTVRHLILKSLADSGYTLDDIDNPEDGKKAPKR
tara:strand:+ start:258 stop:653 length:396 start_codon:yes stop_codon:yes gene_type:complete